MARAKKRTLDAETYPDPGEEDIIDAEVKESAGERMRNAGSRAGAGARNAYRRRQERKDNTPQGQRAKYRRKQAREQQRARAAAGEGDPLAKLKLQTQLQQGAFTSWLRTSGITAPGQTKPSQRQKLSSLHDAYASMMVMQCMEPLRNGMSAHSVISTVGMATAMSFFSPNFRTKVGEQLGQMTTAIGGKLNLKARRNAKVATQGEKAREKEARHFDKTGQGRESMSKRDRRRLERLNRMERGDRELFTEHSAALAHVGIVQNTYDEMRRPGADQQLVKQNYQSAIRALYECVHEDGLEEQAVARKMRMIAGQIIEHDPRQAAVFTETGHGSFSKTEPQDVVLEGTGQWARIWAGNYISADGNRIITSGAFTPREPKGPGEHQKEVAQTMYDEFISASSPAEFGEIMEQYLLGEVTRQYPEAVEHAEDATARTRLNRARAMFASMEGDGLSEPYPKLVYARAFQESAKAVEKNAPEMVEQWLQSLGEDWEERMHDRIREYTEFGEQAASERQGQGANFWAEPVGQEGDFAHTGSEKPAAEPQQGSSGSRRPGGTPQPAADPPAVLEGGIMDRRSEVGRNPRLLTEHGLVDESQIARMEAAGVSLERAVRAEGDWSIDQDALEGAQDGWTMRTMLIEKMSDHIANDILSTVRAHGTQRSAQNMWPLVRVWRDRTGAMGSLDTNLKPESSDAPWGEDGAWHTRAREMSGMSASMTDLSVVEQDRLHSLAYVRALEKTAAAEPSCGEFVRKMVAERGGEPRNWAQCEYETALEHGHSGQRQATYQQECEWFKMKPVTSGSVRSWLSSMLARNKQQKVRRHPGASGVEAGQRPAVSSVPSATGLEQQSGPDLGG